MRWRRILITTLAIAGTGLLLSKLDHNAQRGPELRQWTLENHSTKVPGMGSVPGVDLKDLGSMRLHFGDDPSFASRDFVDSTWQDINASEDSILPGQGVHWLRFVLLPDTALRGKSVLLGLDREMPAEVFLNGSPLFTIPTEPGSANGKERVPVPFLEPVAFRCDGKPETIAIRLDPADAHTARAYADHVTLHAAGMAFATQRTMAQYGVFIGTNLVILVLALVIWYFERREKHWLYLALLSFFSALDSFCDFGVNAGFGGSAGTVSNILGAIQFAIAPWPLFLLVLTLGTLLGQISPKRMRWYRIAIITASVTGLAFVIGVLYSRLNASTNSLGIRFEVNFESPVLGISVVVLVLLFAAAMGWFAVEVVRLGYKLIRSKGYVRWIGAGALASSLLAFMLKMGARIGGNEGGLASVLQVVGDYCSHLAVPLSVAIFLAIRSAHQNKLVARQRDELDLEVKERTAELSAEKERSDELLLNILPQEVADELKATGAAKARYFDMASVLFTDFQGFTGMAAQLGAEVLLHELNTCFEAFDAIITRHGIEKIKTIGDAYMCVGGLPDPKTSSPVAVVQAALEMQEFMAARKKERDAQGKPAFEMRLGIHTGPVVAGIVGVKKFQYDIWGDTVNTASRMESSGEVGQVNISEATYELVKDASTSFGTTLFTFTPRGKMQVKGKGEMEMYFVGRR